MIPGRMLAPLTELNFDLVWHQMPPHVKEAFVGAPQKVKLMPGFTLYKFTEYYIANRQGRITEWWSPVQAYGNDPGLAARINLARHLGASPAELTRVVAAVKENWNALTHVLQARLVKPVYGFWGQCAPQVRRDGGQQARPGSVAPAAQIGGKVVRTKRLPGQAWQFYIPNLTSAHILEVSREPV